MPSVQDIQRTLSLVTLFHSWALIYENPRQQVQICMYKPLIKDNSTLCLIVSNLVSEHRAAFTNQILFKEQQ